MISQNEVVLVTGAAGGRQGSTGKLVTQMLRERGVHVRALVHKLDDRSEALRALGAEVVQGDLLDLPSVRNAMVGVKRAMFVYPVRQGLLKATSTFAAASRETGVEVVANLSQLLSSNIGEEPTPHQVRHWLGEQIFNWAEVGAVHLNPPVFFENLRALVLGSVAKANVVALPWGPPDTKIPMIAAEDVARVAVGVLTGPKHEAGTVLPMIGAVVRVGDIAEHLSTLLDRPIKYVEISDEQWLQNVAQAGLPPEALEHLSHLWRYFRNNFAEFQASYRISPAVEEIGGSKPITLPEFFQTHRELLSGSPAAAPSV